MFCGVLKVRNIIAIIVIVREDLQFKDQEKSILAINRKPESSPALKKMQRLSN